MFYAKYRDNAWYISNNPDQGGYKSYTKTGLWRQIKTNITYQRDMLKFGKVMFFVRHIDGTCQGITLYRSGKRYVVAQK